MSQSVCFLTIENVFVEEVFCGLIDRQYERDTMAAHVQENIDVAPETDYDCEMVHYEIGEGESGTDHFFTEEELVAWYKEGGVDLIEQKVNEQGYEMELIQSESYCVFEHELECEQDEDEEYEMD